MNKKVCMIVRTNIAGDARVDREARTLIENGYQVCVINTGIRDKEKFKLPYAIFKSLGQGSPGQNTFVVLMKYLIFILNAFILALKIRADLYHAHDLYTVIPAYLASRILRRHFVFDAHELWEKKRKSWFKEIQKQVELYFAKKADLVITVNDERSSIIKDELALNKQPMVLKNVPFLRIVERTDLLSKFLEHKGLKNKKLVLYQGGIKTGRSYENLIKHAKYLHPQAVLVFLGHAQSNDYLEFLKNLSSSLSTNNVYFHPFVSNEKLLSYTASADIGLVLYENINRNSFYCASNKLYEYMLCGIPVIASDFPTMQIVKTEELGLCVDPHDPQQIMEAVNKLVLNEKTCNRYSMNAKNLARNQFNWNFESAKLLEAYKGILIN